MKQIAIIFLTMLILQAKVSNGQITYDTTIYTVWVGGVDFKIMQISDNETKYYIADTLTNTFSLYNMDFSPFLMNIATPRPFRGPGYAFYQAMYITRTLFDCDSTNIEYLFEAPVNGGCESTVHIMRTDGTLLFQQDSARCPYCFGDCYGGADWVKPIVNTETGAKLFIDHLCTNSPEVFDIYSLCGQVPTQMFDYSNSNQSFVKLFPNPTSNLLTFEIHPPDNVREYQLVILDSQSKEVRREKIKESFKYTLDVRDLSSGNYFYTLCTKDKSYQAGKFIIAK